MNILTNIENRTKAELLAWLNSEELLIPLHTRLSLPKLKEKVLQLIENYETHLTIAHLASTYR